MHCISYAVVRQCNLVLQEIRNEKAELVLLRVPPAAKEFPEGQAMQFLLYSPAPPCSFPPSSIPAVPKDRP